MQDIIEVMNQKQREKDLQDAERYQQNAEKQRDWVINHIKKFFPFFSVVKNQELENAPAVWLNNGAKNKGVGLSGYAAPGILIDDLIFAVYTNSYCMTFAVAKYNGTEEADPVGRVLSDGANHDIRLSNLLSHLYREQ